MHQDRLNLKHIRHFNMIIHTKQIAQWDAQLVIKLVTYLVTMKCKMELAPVKAKQFCLLFEALYLYLQDTIMQKKTLVTDQTQFKKIVLLLESMVEPLPDIIVRRLCIARCGETPKHKAFLQSQAATVLVPVQAMVYKG